ncbi:MAG TPA: hypothetical protein VMT85_14190 [Thermoanaerobaculia bacterium]|nr:hypothetical protein [Thermoanaerobaculia bacterium]
MRKLFALTSLSAIVAAALLVLLAVPGLCTQADSCPMGQGRGDVAAEIACAPGPTFDCCNGNNTPPSRGSEQLAARQLPPAVTGVSSTLLVPPERPFRVDLGGATDAWSPAAEVPLYTLLATLLI